MPAYPLHNHDASLSHESRSASVVSQTQGTLQSNLPEVSDEEEIEWMLERYLTRRSAKAGITKSIKDLTTDEYYSLLCEDPTSSCDPIGEPLPDVFNEDLILPPKYDAIGITSKFVSPGNAAEFTKSIRDQSPLNSFARDPAFLEVDVETWCSEFHRWVDDRCRIALGYPSVSSESTSRKRPSSSWEGDMTAPTGGFTNRYTNGQANQNKRPRISSSDYNQNNPAGSTLVPTGAVVVNRETTPCFDIGEAGQDAWAIEPGECAVQVEQQEPVNHEHSFSKGYDNVAVNAYGYQQPYHNRGFVLHAL